ncbi:MAG: alanine racemase [Actinobacteria bacterium]|nr:alanine racemase [Actinomycetota bacterium]
MSLPRIVIDLTKIEHNTRVLMSTLGGFGIELAGVVKAVLGSPEVARAMLNGGATIIGDSRLANLRRLASVGAPLMMLRQPMRDEVEEVVSITDVSLVSELRAIEWVARAARAQGKRYKVIIMVETGDLREGVLPAELERFVGEAQRHDSIEIAGIGTNVACLRGAPPTSAMLDRLVKGAEALRAGRHLALPVISGGNSSAWKLLEAGLVPSQVNQVRLGEAILLGQETVDYDPIPGLFQDAVTLEAEFIEVRDKPIEIHLGRMGNNVPSCILALGSQDICRGRLRALDAGIRVSRRSSDHLVVDISASDRTYETGDTAKFIPSYEALLAAMTSPFVEKSFLWPS